MEIIADVGGTRGRWILINKTTIKQIETPGFNPYSHKISSLNHHLDTIKSTINDEKISKITYYGSGINNNEMTDIVKKSIGSHFPDIEIDEKTEDFRINTESDNQLQYALKLLNE